MFYVPRTTVVLSISSEISWTAHARLESTSTFRHQDMPWRGFVCSKWQIMKHVQYEKGSRKLTARISGYTCRNPSAPILIVSSATRPTKFVHATNHHCASWPGPRRWSNIQNVYPDSRMQKLDRERKGIPTSIRNAYPDACIQRLNQKETENTRCHICSLPAQILIGN